MENKAKEKILNISEERTIDKTNKVFNCLTFDEEEEKQRQQ